MLLVASLYVPAYAAPVVLEPLNYANGMSQTAEGTMLYSFRFKSDPYFECFNGSTAAYQTTGLLDWSPLPGYDFYRISISPLGNVVYNGTVIAVDDFKTGAILDVSFSALLELDLKSDGSSGLTYIARSQMLLYWFDKDFNLIKTENCGVVEKSFTYGEVDAWLLQNSYDMNILEDAAFVSPRFVTQIYRPDAGDITRIKSSETLWLDVVVEKDDVNAESMLLENIEKQLDDLNDKADTIINGTPDQQQNASDMLGQAQDNSEAAQDAMDYEDALIEDFFDENGNNLGIEMSKITLFDLFNSDGWGRLMELFEPIMVWPTTSVLMLMVVAVANLSVILFGR